MLRRQFILGITPFLALACRSGESASPSDAPGLAPPDPAPASTPAPLLPAAPQAQPAADAASTAAPLPAHIILARAAEARTHVAVTYDPAYVRLAYPGGDPPDDRGVCSDVVIRAYRGAGVDLQVSVHEDMRANFSAYPRIWGLSRPDRNIDHRRVPNLETFFRRMGADLPADTRENLLEPGDLIAWRINDRLPHIGVVSTQRTSSGKVLIAHNIGRGPELEACFDAWPRTGIYRHRPWTS